MPRSVADRAQAVEAASELFRTCGYERASIEDVVRATGFNRYALYQEFGGKRELFIAAVERFHEASMDDLAGLLAAPGARAFHALRAYFEGPLDDLVRENDAPGSLMCQAAFEVAPGDPDLHARLMVLLAEKRRMITLALARARDEGDLRGDVPPETAGALLMCTMFGLAAQAHAGMARDHLAVGLDAAFTALSPLTA